MADDRQTMASERLGTVYRTQQGLFCLDERDESVSAALIGKGHYGRQTLRDLKLYLDHTRDLLVLGAHVGALIVPMAGMVRSIAAVEAVPDTFRLLEANLALNGLGNVKAYNIAASDHAGTLEFIDDKRFSGGSKMMPMVDATRYLTETCDVITVPCDRMDTMFQTETFDMAIIDVEGAEVFALRGMPRILSQAHTVAIEFIPLHFRTVSGLGAEEFLAPFEGFQTLYSPRLRRGVHREGFHALISLMLEQRVSDETLIFHRERLNIVKSE